MSFCNKPGRTSLLSASRWAWTWWRYSRRLWSLTRTGYKKRKTNPFQYFYSSISFQKKHLFFLLETFTFSLCQWFTFSFLVSAWNFYNHFLIYHHIISYIIYHISVIIYQVSHIIYHVYVGTMKWRALDSSPAYGLCTATRAKMRKNESEQRKWKSVAQKIWIWLSDHFDTHTCYERLWRWRLKNQIHRNPSKITVWPIMLYFKSWGSMGGGSQIQEDRENRWSTCSMEE